jgi:hypothetical protein
MGGIYQSLAVAASVTLAGASNLPITFNVADNGGTPTLVKDPFSEIRAHAAAISAETKVLPRSANIPQKNPNQSYVKQFSQGPQDRASTRPGFALQPGKIAQTNVKKVGASHTPRPTTLAQAYNAMNLNPTPSVKPLPVTPETRRKEDMKKSPDGGVIAALRFGFEVVAAATHSPAAVAVSVAFRDKPAQRVPTRPQHRPWAGIVGPGLNFV